MVCRPEHQLPAYQSFVKQVKERDENKCQFPGCTKRRFGIEVHHIVRWKDSIALRYNPDNGVCLCNKHHKMVTGQEMAYAPLFIKVVQVNKMKRIIKER